MVKYVLLLSVFILSVPSLSSATVLTDDQLHKLFGYDLTQAPYYLRYTFGKKYGKDWASSYYLERENFLKNYEVNVAVEQKQERAEARAESIKEKADARQKKAEARAERAKLKARADELKAEAKAEALRQKDFDTAIRDQSKSLSQMEREATRGGAEVDGPPGAPSDSDQGSGQGSY